MRTYREFTFELFDFHWLDSGYQWWISVAEIQVTDWNGALIHIERDTGRWKFDFLYLRNLIHKYRDIWNNG